MPAKILETGSVPINSIKPYHANARIGNVDSIRESLRKNGFYRPVVVWNQTKEILAGNHTWKAAKAEKYKEIERTLIDCDEQTAKRINLVDNRTPELGTYDETALIDLLSSLPDLEGTGWIDQDLTDLIAKIDGDLDGDGAGEMPDDDYVPQLGVIVLCENEKQQQAVYGELQKLTDRRGTFGGVELKVVSV